MKTAYAWLFMAIILVSFWSYVVNLAMTWQA
jgi:hypothetical protein